MTSPAGTRNTAVPLYVTPTGTGSIRALSATASTAASATKNSYNGALASIQIVVPETTVTNGQGNAANVVLNTWPGSGWENGTDFGGLSTDTVSFPAQTVNVKVSATSNQAPGTGGRFAVTVGLYAGTVYLGQSATVTAAPYTANVAQTLDLPVSIAANITAPGNSKLRLAMVVNVPGQVLRTETITVNYDTTGTRLTDSVVWVMQATRSFSASSLGVATLARGLTAGRTFAIATAGTPSRTVMLVGLPRVVTTLGIASLQRQTSKRHTATTLATVTMRRQSGKALNVTTAGTASLAKAVRKALVASTTGTATIQRAATAARTFTTTTTGAASMLVQMGERVLNRLGGGATSVYKKMIVVFDD